MTELTGFYCSRPQISPCLFSSISYDTVEKISFFNIIASEDGILKYPDQHEHPWFWNSNQKIDVHHYWVKDGIHRDTSHRQTKTYYEGRNPRGGLQKKWQGHLSHLLGVKKVVIVALTLFNFKRSMVGAWELLLYLLGYWAKQNTTGLWYAVLELAPLKG